MLLLTPKELRQLTDAVEDHFVALILELFGVQAAGVDEREIDRLVLEGVLTKETGDKLKLTGFDKDPIGDSFITGMVLARMRDLQGQYDDRGASFTLEMAEAELKRDPVPLSDAEKFAIQSARNTAGQYCQGLGAIVEKDVRDTAAQTSDEVERWYKDHIKEATAESIARRETAQQLRGKLGQLTGDWGRDLERIASTELQNAYQEGTAAWIKQDAPEGGQALVAKIPNGNACEECKRLYTTDGTTPKVFTLNALEEFGSNVGRKRKDMVPTLEAAHPWCRCTLVYVPAGYEFNGNKLQPIKEYTPPTEARGEEE